MGLPKGPECQGLPEVRTLLSLIRRVPESADPAGWRAEGAPAVFGEPRPLPQVCAPQGAPAFSTGAKQVPPCVGVGRG